MEYSISYFALKLVNYSFFFWLPYYIHNVFHWPDSESNSVSIWFDVGGIIGGVIGGVGSDLWGYRSPVVFAMAFSAVPSLVGLNNSPPTKAAASSLMALVGFFVGGASNIIGAACAAGNVEINFCCTIIWPRQPVFKKQAQRQVFWLKI